MAHGWEHAVKMIDMEREVPCLHPVTGWARSPTSPNHGDGQSFPDSPGAAFLFQAFFLSIPGM